MIFMCEGLNFWEVLSVPCYLWYREHSYSQQAHNALSYTTEQGAEQTAQAFQEQQYIFGEYIERLWAYLTIEQLLEKR